MIVDEDLYIFYSLVRKSDFADVLVLGKWVPIKYCIRILDDIFSEGGMSTDVQYVDIKYERRGKPE